MNRFKFRAECLGDVMRLMDILNFKNINIDTDIGDNSTPDCTVEVSTKLSEKEVLFAINHLDDSHVMSETIKPIDEYTGIRK